MELIAAVCIAGPLGYFVSPRRRALIAYLGLWVVVFPIQSAIVLSDDFDPLYFVVNALILALGIALNRAGSVLRERRRVKQADLSAEVAA